MSGGLHRRGSRRGSTARLRLLAILTLAATSAVAAPTSYSCPESASASSGWSKPASPSPSLGEGWALFDGRPEDMAMLAPDRDTGRVQTFSIDSGGEIWVRCGAGRPVVIWERRLDSGLKSCELRYGGQKSRPVFERTLVCR